MPPKKKPKRNYTLSMTDIATGSSHRVVPGSVVANTGTH